MDIKFDRLQKSDRDNLVMVSQRWLRPVLRKFCKTTTSLIFLERLVDDTLLFGKFQDSESIRKMNAPQLKAARIPIERSQSWFYDARTQLMNARLLWVNSNPLHLPNALHTVNFPGMADILIQYLVQVDSSFIEAEHFLRLQDSFQNSVHVYRSVGISKSKWRLDMAPTDIAAITRQSNAATDTKMQTKKLSAQTVDQLMSGWCDEYALNFMPPRTQKEYGQVGLWVRECTKRGETAQEIKDQLKLVVENWGYMQGSLLGKTGKAVPVPKSVSFDFFYKLRRNIVAWLEHLNDLPEGEHSAFHIEKM